LEGTLSNRSAIGARITLFWDEKKQTQVVSGGIGFSSQNQRHVHFGLGESNMADKLIVQWPSGLETEIINPDVNIQHKIVEPS